MGYPQDGLSYYPLSLSSNMRIVSYNKSRHWDYEDQILALRRLQVIYGPG